MSTTMRRFAVFGAVRRVSSGQHRWQIAAGFAIGMVLCGATARSNNPPVDWTAENIAAPSFFQSSWTAGFEPRRSSAPWECLIGELPPPTVAPRQFKTKEKDHALTRN